MLLRASQAPYYSLLVHDIELEVFHALASFYVQRVRSEKEANFQFVYPFCFLLLVGAGTSTYVPLVYDVFRIKVILDFRLLLNTPSLFSQKNAIDNLYLIFKRVIIFSKVGNIIINMNSFGDLPEYVLYVLENSIVSNSYTNINTGW